MLTCKKCGCEVHEDQKVCIQCGTRTIRGDGFDYDQKTFTITKNMKIGAAILAFLVVVGILINALRVTPPDVVAKDFFTAVADRKVNAAEKYTTPNVESYLQTRGMDLRAIADECYSAISGENAKYSLAKPVMSGDKAATVVATLTYPDGRQKPYKIELTKQGRQWAVNKMDW